VWLHTNNREEAIVANVLVTRPLNISFTRDIVGNNLNLWLELVGRVLPVQFNNKRDDFVWLLNKGAFTVSSMYKDILKETSLNIHWTAWKLKLPLKINKNFMVLGEKDSLSSLQI